MTNLLYQTDAYLKEFDAKIIGLDLDAHAVVLDQSAFYPGGGGQPCDFGTLEVGGNVYQVNKTKKQGDDVLHFIAGQEPLPETGASVHGVIDWERRYKLMRTHTALIFCVELYFVITVRLLQAEIWNRLLGGWILNLSACRPDWSTILKPG